jgi:hypothetical protein
VNDLQHGHVYEQGPDTDRWVGWMRPEAAITAGDESPLHEDWSREIEQIVEHAKQQFRERTSWEGDIRQGPYVAGLMPPDHGQEFQVAVGLKQDNNGMIFVWSPYEMPWLREHEKS